MTFEAAYETYWPLAVRVAFRILRNRGDAEDAAADALIRVWRHWDRVTDVKNYVLTAVRNAALDLLHRRRLVRWRDLDAALDRPAPDDPARTFEEQEAIGEAVTALNTLYPTYRAALWLYHVDGEGYAGVAARLGTTPGTIKTTLHRARRQFRAYRAGRAIETRRRPSRRVLE